MRADFSFSHNFGEKIRLKEGHAEKEIISNVILRSSKVNQGQLGLFSFMYPHLLSSGQKWREYENSLQRYAHICAQLLNWGPFGPTVLLKSSKSNCAGIIVGMVSWSVGHNYLRLVEGLAINSFRFLAIQYKITLYRLQLQYIYMWYLVKSNNIQLVKNQ